MSTYQVNARDARYRCWVRWDAGVQSYFLYVARALSENIDTAQNGHAVLYLGTHDREIDSVEELAERAPPFAEITEEMMRIVREDRLKKPASRAQASRSAHSLRERRA